MKLTLTRKEVEALQILLPFGFSNIDEVNSYSNTKKIEAECLNKLEKKIYDTILLNRLPPRRGGRMKVYQVTYETIAGRDSCLIKASADKVARKRSHLRFPTASIFCMYEKKLLTRKLNDRHLQANTKKSHLNK